MEFYGIIIRSANLATAGNMPNWINSNYTTPGKPGGLTAVYSKKDNSASPITRIEPILNYENLSLIKNFPQHFDLNNSKVSWNGQLEAAESGEFHFILHYAGYVKVYLNNEPVVKERWRTAWDPNDSQI